MTHTRALSYEVVEGWEQLLCALGSGLDAVRGNWEEGPVYNAVGDAYQAVWFLQVDPRTDFGLFHEGMTDGLRLLAQEHDSVTALSARNIWFSGDLVGQSVRPWVLRWDGKSVRPARQIPRRTHPPSGLERLFESILVCTPVTAGGIDWGILRWIDRIATHFAATQLG